MFRSKGRPIVASVCLFVFALLVVACGTTYNVNPLGYGYAIDQTGSPTPRSVTFPTVTPGTVDTLLKQGGMGNTLDTFFTKYTPTKISHPPTLYAFQQTLDTFPDGSILFVSFENGSQDRVPRAVQISLVPGSNHPTTYAQSEAFAQSLLPDDRTGPVTVQALDTNKGKCLAMVWNSSDLSKIFPPEDFLGGTSGKLGKSGDVVVSFFPDVEYGGGTDYPNMPSDAPITNISSDNVILNPNIVGSLLISLGDAPAC